MKPVHDSFYRFPREHLRIPGRCRVRIYKRKNGARTVVLTELRNNAGESINSACERIATDLAARWRLHPQTTRWIQHDSPHGDLPERFDQLEFTWDSNRTASDPQWQHLGGEQVEALTGDTLNALNRSLGDDEVKTGQRFLTSLRQSRFIAPTRP